MIISYKYKYLFIEVAHTGTTAISRELRNYYEGSLILRKHSTYTEFLGQASEEEKNYFVFAGIRNPLDEAVSLYFKYRTNHKDKFIRPEARAENGGSVTRANLKRFSFINDADTDFAGYFRKFYRLPYNNVQSSLTHGYCDFIIHFENLQEDFAKVLELIGIEQVRPLPRLNKTGEKKKNFASYYTPDIIPQAKRVFGPFMKERGYEFPQGWGDNNVSWLDTLEYRSIVKLKDLYWKHFRWSPYFYGRLLRRFI